MSASSHKTAPLTLLRDEIRALFRDLNDVPWSRDGNRAPPAVDVIDTPDAIEIRVDLLAIGPDALTVELEGDDLTVRGARRIEVEEKAGGSMRSNQRTRHFLRRIQLPADLRVAECDARYRSGLLEIVLRKSRSSKSSARS